MKNVFKSTATLLVVSGILVSCSDEKIKNMDPMSNETQTEASHMYKNGDIIPGQYIVQVSDKIIEADLKSAPNYSAKQEVVRRSIQSLTLMPEVDFNAKLVATYSSSIKGVAIQLNAAQLASLKANVAITSIEPDRFVMLAPGGKGKPGGGGGSEPQSVPYGITRVGGGQTYTGSNTAWIIDSGIDLDHPDLNVNASKSASFLGGKDANDPNDGNGHGTHVAGTVAAINNSIGVVGVAAGAEVVSVRVLDRRGSGSLSGVIAGVDYAAANAKAGDVANMSLGGGVSTSLDDAVKAAASTGLKFSLAAGNESDDANEHSPARANGANIFTVSAMDINDNFAYFSNFGNPPVDFCAPGVSIKSCWKDGGYNTISGTSMAAPHVAGLLLLGNIRDGGNVNGDPDGNADIIAIH